MLVDERGFDPDFERVLISAILYTDGFFQKFKSLLGADMFTDAFCRFIIDKVQAYYNEHHIVPDVRILADIIKRSNFKDISGVLNFLSELTEIEDIEYIVNRVLEWAKWSEVNNVLSTMEGMDPRELAREMQRAACVGDDLLLDYTKLESEDETDDAERIVVPTPWSWLNAKLRGGPECGDLCIALTCINVGKTTTLVNIARAGLMWGKSVVYFTFEDGEQKIKRRLKQSIANMTIDEILNNREEASKRVADLMSYGGDIVIKDLRTRRSTVEDAMAFVKSVEDTTGRKVDLVCTDYADRFKPMTKRNEPRHEYREIFEDSKFMARELGVVHWTATQSNKSRTGQEIVSIEHAGEAYGKAESADLAVGLGQTPDDEKVNRISLFTAKVRDAKKHEILSLFADFDRQRIEDPSDELYQSEQNSRLLA